MNNGSPYQSMNEVISEVRIDTQNVSGVFTTVMPLTWMGNTSRVLCAYSESYLRVGTAVYIKPNAPTCCCPGYYSTTTNSGSFFCPKGPTGMCLDVTAILVL